MTTYSSDDLRALSMGAAIKAVCCACGGWMDWGSDGRVRFLCRDSDGHVGVFFPKWVVEGLKENRQLIARYVELVREDEKQRADMQLRLECSKSFRGYPRG